MIAPTQRPPRAFRRPQPSYRTGRPGLFSLLFLLAAHSTGFLGSADHRLLAQIPGATPADSIPALFARADAILAGSLISSLLLVDPAEHVDQQLSEIASRDADPSVGIYQFGEALGRGRVSTALAAAPLVWGLVADDARARRIGLHAFESLFATSFLTRFFKQAIGRTRPSCGADSDEFVPFSTEACHHSFPSGHTARAFAIATTFALEFGEASPWVPWVSYTLATWTGLTRVRDRAHWPTDVLGGAALGVLTGRLVHRLNYGHDREDPFLLAIFVEPDGTMVISANIAVR